MGTKLVIAEKPELARNIARAVCGAREERPRLPYRGDGYVIDACAGHLLRLAEPQEIDARKWGSPWREEQLPVLPNPWPKVVAEGKEAIVERIRRELGECDGVVHAGDPDDEGQLIVDELLDYLGYDGPVERVLVNDSIDKNIRRAFDEFTPNEGHVAAGRSAEARQLADFCFGVSESRLATVRAGHGRKFSVGRVQTPTLGLVVRRDEEIASHVAVPYYVVTATAAGLAEGDVTMTLKPREDLLEDKRLTDKSVADEAAAALEGLEAQATTKVERKRAVAPLPYNLTELTADMSKRHQMGAQQVMAATQRLRDEFRAITYNRSDCQYLPEAALAEAPQTLGQAMRNVRASWELDFSVHPRCFDDSKIDAHTGIIPQDIAVDTSRLADDELKVYTAIVERYAMQFAGPEVFDVSTTTAPCEHGELVHRARRQVEPGWRSVADDGSGDKGFDAGWVDEGARNARLSGAKVEEKRTKPKAPYTEGTLVKDMANAAKYLRDPSLKEVMRRKDEGKPGEHGSIGTTATRAAIIEGLKRSGYITEKKGRILSTKLGRDFYHACPEEISGVDTTARWWLIQERVEAGEEDEYAVARSVCEVFEQHRATAWIGVSLDGNSTERIGPCPLCGSAVVDHGPRAKQYVCASNRWRKDADGKWEQVAGCGFALWKELYGHKLTKAQAKGLLETGRSKPLVCRSRKTGKEYMGIITLDDKGRPGIEFAQNTRVPQKGKKRAV